MIGKKLTPILIELENTIIEFDFRQQKPNYDKEALRAACKIFYHVLLDSMYNMQNRESMSLEDRCNMATAAGNDLHKFINTYTGEDSYEFYK
jgi:hypothetical protein